MKFFCFSLLNLLAGLLAYLVTCLPCCYLMIEIFEFKGLEWFLPKLSQAAPFCCLAQMAISVEFLDCFSVIALFLGPHEWHIALVRCIVKEDKTVSLRTSVSNGLIIISFLFYMDWDSSIKSLFGFVCVG